jgi:hypothetical protein
MIIKITLFSPFVAKTPSRANAEGSQFGRSQRGVGVRDGREDRYVEKLLEGCILLAVNDLLIAPHNPKALIRHIYALIHALACGKDTLEHLQDAGVGTRSGGGTTTAGSVGWSGNHSGRITMRSSWILGHCRAK